MLARSCARIAASLGVGRQIELPTRQSAQQWQQTAQQQWAKFSTEDNTIEDEYYTRFDVHSQRSVQCAATRATQINSINEKFAEAREEIEFAREDAETVYFNDSAEEARRAVADVLDRVNSEEQAKLQRSMGLKMEQLKAELKELNEIHA
eukprot:gene12233-12371_t